MSNIDQLAQQIPALRDSNTSELIQKLQLINDMRALQASKVDRKLYIGNIPQNLTPQTVWKSNYYMIILYYTIQS